MCGEQPEDTGPSYADLGSPPRVRGTGRIYDATDLERGITPACAGNSAVMDPPSGQI